MKGKRKVAVNLIFGFTLFSCIFFSLAVFIEQFNGLGHTIENERLTYVSEIRNQLIGNIEVEKEQQMFLADTYIRILETIKPKDFEEINDILSDDHNQVSEDYLFFMDQNGQIYDKKGELQPFLNRDLTDCLLKRQTAVFSYIQTDEPNTYWVYGEPVENMAFDGIEIHAIITARSLERFWKKMEVSFSEDVRFSYIVSKSGTVLAVPSATGTDKQINIFSMLEEAGVSIEEIQEIQEDFQTGAQSQRFLSYKNNRWLIDYCSCFFDDWVVVVLLPMTVTAADTYRMMTMTLAAVLILVGSILAFLGFVIGQLFIREHKRNKVVQQEKLQLEMAQKVADSKSSFLAKMSHDIRTPLNGIIGILEVITYKVNGDQELITYTAKARKAAEYLLGILNDILDSSKMESGKMELYLDAINLQEFLDELVAMVEIQIADKQLEFQLRKKGDMNTSYLIDKLRLNQILMNLLSNAIKFTDSGGRISLSVIVTDDSMARDRVQFVVADSGMGMSENYLKHLFQPFEQEDSSVSLNYGGSGLGLSIAKNLTELMDGQIEVSSKKGIGSAFVVTFPFIKSEEPDVQSEKEETDRSILLEGRSVLLVEDNELNAEIARELLEIQFGVTVDLAENGAEAVKKFTDSQEGAYDWILMDIRMPIMNGLEAADAIRLSGHPQAKQIPIIAMSANAFEEDVALSLAHGMNAHLSKPIDIEKVEEILQLSLSGEYLDRIKAE